MARRVRGDPDIRPYAGSPEQHEAQRKWAEREEAHRRSVVTALEVADFESLGVDRHAPSPTRRLAGVGARRKLANSGMAAWAIVRQLDWACPDADAGARVNPSPFDRAGGQAEAAEHYRTAIEPAVWESEAAHYAYWMAVDLLRIAAEGGEETELPDGAVYEPLDGSGQRWIYRSSGWEPLPFGRESG